MKAIYAGAVFAAFLTISTVASADEVASFGFQGNLDSSLGGSSLSAVDPQGANNYSTAVLYGQTRQVYNTVGAAGTGNNAGLQLNINGLLNANSDYSVEILFSYANTSGWRKIMDNSNLTADQGLYVSPSSTLDYYPQSAGATTLSANTYYNMVLTYSAATETTDIYLNGALEASTISPDANIASTSNPLSFFMDDAATSHNEYTNASVGLINVWNTALSSDQVSSIENNPFTPAPEPCSLIALGGGIAAIIAKRRRS